MIRLVGLMLVSLLTLAGQATGWEFTIQGPVTITGPGAAPIVIPTPPPVTPVVTPPIVPPPPVVPPITDHTPFVFPPQPPPDNIVGRRYIIGLCPDSGESCFASLPEFSSPLPYSHGLACILPAGMRHRGQSLWGMRLWAPYAWGTSAPAKIRTLCAGGAL